MLVMLNMNAGFNLVCCRSADFSVSAKSHDEAGLLDAHVMYCLHAMLQLDVCSCTAIADNADKWDSEQGDKLRVAATAP